MGSDLLAPPAPTPAEVRYGGQLANLQDPNLKRGGDSPQLSRYFAALRRYKWLLLTVLGIGSAASVSATRFVRPQYEVHATIWLAAETPQGRTAGPFRAGE